MTVKQYLQSYRKLEAVYITTLEQIKSIERDMITIKSPGFDERVQSSAKNDPIGELVCELESEKGKLALKITGYKAKMLLIRNQIIEVGKTDEEFYILLLMRYVLHKDWKFICDRLAISRAQANLVHGRALQEFDSIFHVSN